MKYYSEETKKLYDSEEELAKAEEVVKEAREKREQLLKEKKEQRAARAKEVEDAFKEAKEAADKANKLLSEFCKDYGSFHTTLKDPFRNIFDMFWNW